MAPRPFYPDAVPVAVEQLLVVEQARIVRFIVEPTAPLTKDIVEIDSLDVERTISLNARVHRSPFRDASSPSATVLSALDGEHVPRQIPPHFEDYERVIVHPLFDLHQREKGLLRDLEVQRAVAVLEHRDATVGMRSDGYV